MQALNNMLDKLKTLGKNIKREIAVYKLVIQDKRTPKLAKVLLGLGVGYLLLPFDLIPDFIPLFGQVDDAIIVSALIVLALKIVPKEVVEDCRKKALEKK